MQDGLEIIKNVCQCDMIQIIQIYKVLEKLNGAIIIDNK